MFAAIPVVIQGGPSVADWLTAGGTAALAVGVGIAAAQLFDSRKTRNAELAQEMSANWDSEALVKAREKIRALGQVSPAQLAEKVSNARDQGTEDYYIYLRELDFFEDLGVLYGQGILRVKLIEAGIGSIVRDRWLMWEEYVKALRGTDHPSYYLNFQLLAKRLDGRQKGIWRRCRIAIVQFLIRRLS